MPIKKKKGTSIKGLKKNKEMAPPPGMMEGMPPIMPKKKKAKKPKKVM